MLSLLAALTADCPAADRRTVEGPVAECSPVDRPSSFFSDGDWAIALYEIPEH